MLSATFVFSLRVDPI